MTHKRSYIAVAAAFIFCFSFEGMIGLGANLDRNRELMEERVRTSQTSYDGVNETAVEANMSALDSYNETLKTEHKLYNCKGGCR